MGLMPLATGGSRGVVSDRRSDFVSCRRPWERRSASLVKEMNGFV